MKSQLRWKSNPLITVGALTVVSVAAACLYTKTGLAIARAVMTRQRKIYSESERRG